MVIPMKSIDKSSKGRRKITIKLLDNKNSIQVKFSKRRKDLFKKASELCILCGAEIGIIVFSPNGDKGRAFTFGHPNVEVIIERYVTGNFYGSDPVPIMSVINDLNEESVEAVVELQKEEKMKSAAAVAEGWENGGGGGFWFDQPIDDMALEELERFMAALMELRSNAVSRVDEMEGRSGGGSHVAMDYQLPAHTVYLQFKARPNRVEWAYLSHGPN